jgi:hypothetical protein
MTNKELVYSIFEVALNNSHYRQLVIWVAHEDYLRIREILPLDEGDVHDQWPDLSLWVWVVRTDNCLPIEGPVEPGHIRCFPITDEEWDKLKSYAQVESRDFSLEEA